jgi:2,3-bisphosphoglycerate-independent phosphoglycerate mutase
VTYFWNGNRSGKFDGETWQEVPSDVVPFEQRPWMKAAEIADAMIAALQSGKYKTCAATSPTATWSATPAISARRRWPSKPSTWRWRACCCRSIDALGGVALITADHGNADEMFELDKKTKQPAQNKDGSFKAKTAHTLNPVPLILYDNVTGGKLGLKQTETGRPVEHRRHGGATCSAWRSTPSGTRACWRGSWRGLSLVRQVHAQNSQSSMASISRIGR